MEHHFTACEPLCLMLQPWLFRRGGIVQVVATGRTMSLVMLSSLNSYLVEFIDQSGEFLGISLWSECQL